MAHSGVIRTIDKVGRIALPVAIRNSLNLKPGSKVELTMQGASLVVERFDPVCVLCGTGKDTDLYRTLDSKGGERSIRLCHHCKTQLASATPVVKAMNDEEDDEGDIDL